MTDPTLAMILVRHDIICGGYADTIRHVGAERDEWMARAVKAEEQLAAPRTCPVCGASETHDIPTVIVRLQEDLRRVSTEADALRAKLTPP
jgi:deoxycytidylate deaminase